MISVRMISRFTPGTPLQYPLNVQNISIYWPSQGANNAAFIGKMASLFVYQDTDGDGNPANATLIGGPFAALRTP